MHKRFSWLLALALLLLLVSCQLLNEIDLVAGDDPVGQYGVDRASAVVLAGGQPRTLDPALTHGGPGGIPGHLFSGLVTLTPQLAIEPDLAAGWEIDATGTVYTFYLHPNARYHDGRDVTAQDVRFSWERALDPATGSDTALTYLGDIVGSAAMADGSASSLSGVAIIDDKTVQVTIDAPKPTFLAKLTYPVTFLVDAQQVDRADWEREPNGTGPFTLERWRDDEVLILQRNVATVGTVPQVEHVVFLMDAGIPLSLYERGIIDRVGVGGSTLERMRDPNSDFSAELRSNVSMCTNFVGYDVTQPPFDDARVRRAFNHALNRERIVDGLYRGSALPANSILPPGMPGFRPRTGYTYDPALARELVRQAGYETLPPLRYTTSGFTDAGGIETALISQWQEVFDVEVVPELIEPTQYLNETFAGNIGHFFDFGWCADYADPENFLDILFYTDAQTNLGGFRSADFDTLLDRARVEPNVAERLRLYGEAETLLLEEAPVVLVAHGISAELVSPRLQNYALTPLSVPQWHRVTLAER